jgi:protein-L-isoaspartate(D-aspartate) O-methyltransferase
MRVVDRGDFTGRSNAYSDRPQGIGYNATISAPHMHGYALEWLEEYLRPGSRVLDVGSGSGYLTVSFALMLGPDAPGKVVGIDHVPQLVDDSIGNIRKSWSRLLDSGSVEMITGDGRNGYPAHAPYNAIHVGAAAPTIPEPLIQQLAPGGRMVIPVGPQGQPQAIYFVDKDTSGQVKQTRKLGVSYVPLTSKSQQCAGY